MYDELFALIARTNRLQPDLLDPDTAIQAGEGPRLAHLLADAAAATSGGRAWGRISWRYLAGQRATAVLDGADHWDTHRAWPPEHEPGALPDEIADAAELLTLLAGSGTALDTPDPGDTDTWRSVFVPIATQQPDALPAPFAAAYQHAEQRLHQVRDTIENWLTAGPATDPGQQDAPLWAAVDPSEDTPNHEHLIDVLTQRPTLIPALRGAITQLITAGAVSGVDELRVAHALRVTQRGLPAWRVALIDPTLNHIPFLDDLDRVSHFFHTVGHHPDI